MPQAHLRLYDDALRQRRDAVRDWARCHTDLPAALAALGLTERSWQRIYAGTKRPPPGLLRDMADHHTSDPAIADRLRAAAQAGEGPDAR